MSKNAGKAFEDDFKKSIPDYCFCHRLKDSSQSFIESNFSKFSWDNPCDFFVWNGNLRLFFAIECKSAKTKSISVQMNKEDKSSKMIKYHQIKSLTQISNYEGAIAGFFVNFRDEINNMERTYFIDITNFNKMMKEINKVSFNEIDLILSGGIKINGVKKRTRYTWDIHDFFECEYNKTNKIDNKLEAAI